MTKAMKLAGFAGVAMDLVYSESLDYLDEAGFIMGLVSILKLLPGGLAVLAPVCSSFSPMSSSQSCRTPRTPLGDDCRIFVSTGNVIGIRVILTLILIQALDLLYVLEQPGGSSFQLLPRFDQFRRGIARIIKITFWMKSYGSKTAKRTMIFSNSQQMKRLDMGTVAKDPVCCEKE